MRKKSKKIKKVGEKVHCPKCKSKDLNFMPWLGLIYECRNCGWRGPVVVRKGKLGRGRKVSSRKV